MNPLCCLLLQTQLVMTVVSVGIPVREEAVAMGPGPQLRVKRVGFEMAADGLILDSFPRSTGS